MEDVGCFVNFVDIKLDLHGEDLKWRFQASRMFDVETPQCCTGVVSFWVEGITGIDVVEVAYFASKISHLKLRCDQSALAHRFESSLIMQVHFLKW